MAVWKAPDRYPPIPSARRLWSQVRQLLHPTSAAIEQGHLGLRQVTETAIDHRDRHVTQSLEVLPGTSLFQKEICQYLNLPIRGYQAWLPATSFAQLWPMTMPSP